MTDSEYETSDRLTTLDTEIAETTSRLEAIEQERGEALNAKASGESGADETLANLRDERTRLQDYLGDSHAARELEVQRLEHAHREAIAQAQEARREEIQQHQEATYKAAQKCDRAFNTITTALQELDDASGRLAAIHGNGAGRSIAREAMEVLRHRLEATARGSSDGGWRVVHKVPHEGLTESAILPDSLDELTGNQ